MANYLIQLLPHDTFFFGTGKEFGENNQNYFVQSGYFPQQTSLLGMLRYQILCQSGKNIFNNNKIQNKEKAAELIGQRSFTKDEKLEFGVIKSLSPIFLIKDDKKLYPLGKEYQKEDEKWVLRQISEDFTLLQDYQPKNGLPELWTDGVDKYSLEDIFETAEQIGIRKNYKGGTEEKAFYKQTYRRFKSGFSFAFYAEIEIELHDSSLVVLGGEQKTFSMKVRKEEKSIDYNYQASKNVHKVILLSDAFIPKETINKCDFAITDTVDFRCLQARIEETDKYYNIRKEKDKEIEYNKSNLHKSVKLELYKRGSVFYFKFEKDMTEFANQLEQSEFYTIGYNHYKNIKKH